MSNLWVGLHFVAKPSFYFPSYPEQYAPKPVPSLSEWEQLWGAWDAVTQTMIPEDSLLSKPIKLRNVCIFYLGHIPTFLDIHLTRATEEKPTEPAYFTKIFERGIDPDVENPANCHAHSEIPDTWPELQHILAFQDQVRKRARGVYASGAAKNDANVGRALWLTFEHEAMHLETLLYMLIQSENVLAPPGTPVPDFGAEAYQAEAVAVENEWFTIPESNIVLGLDDPDNAPSTDRYFGWDTEKPPRSKHVEAFRTKARPITNGEYAEYLVKTGKSSIPASWSDKPYASLDAGKGNKRDSVLNGTNGYSNGLNEPAQNVMHGKYVRTVFGAIPLRYALNWPVVASYDELVGCAQWMGGRIPTLEEVRSIYNYVERDRSKEIAKSLGKTIPAVNR